MLACTGESLFKVSWFWSILLRLLGIEEIISHEFIGLFELVGKCEIGMVSEKEGESLRGEALLWTTEDRK